MAQPTSAFTVEDEVNLFKEFLRIKTMHPTPDLKGCTAWLRAQADQMGLEYQTVEFAPGLPIVILTLRGQEPSLPSVVLNCHMDVVPVVEEKWTALPKGETPFSAWEDPSTGKIYARGSQDMKCIGAEYLCALRRLAAQAGAGSPLRFRRTIHLVWVPDEEIGGPQGMKPFAKSDAFRALNVGVALDEGLAHPDNTFVVYYGERTGLWARYKATGPVGHGSKLIPETAVERLLAAGRRLSDIRAENVAKLESSDKLRLGDVTTVNITVLQGGTSSDGGKTFAPNVIPSDAMITVDIRIAPGEFQSMMKELVQLAKDNNLELDFPNYPPGEWPEKANSINGPASNRWYDIIDGCLRPWGAKIEKQIFPAMTDSRYIRETGVPAFGFSPIRNTPSLLHDHNEYLTREGYLEGIAIYTDLIPKLANAPATIDSHL